MFYKQKMPNRNPGFLNLTTLKNPVHKGITGFMYILIMWFLPYIRWDVYIKFDSGINLVLSRLVPVTEKNTIHQSKDC